MLESIQKAVKSDFQTSSSISIKRSHSSIAHTMLVKDDVISILQKGPIKVNDLINALRDKLHVEPRNKELLKEILKDVAYFESGSGGGSEIERLITLKPKK